METTWPYSEVTRGAQKSCAKHLDQSNGSYVSSDGRGHRRDRRQCGLPLSLTVGYYQQNEVCVCVCLCSIECACYLCCGDRRGCGTQLSVGSSAACGQAALIWPPLARTRCGGCRRSDRWATACPRGRRRLLARRGGRAQVGAGSRLCPLIITKPRSLLSLLPVTGCHLYFYRNITSPVNKSVCVFVFVFNVLLRHISVLSVVFMYFFVLHANANVIL